MAKQIVNLSDTVKTFQEKVNIISADVGWRGNLTTTQDSDIVGGINELDSDIGARPHTNLTTDAKTLTGAVNELDGRLDSANNTQINSAKLHMRDSSATNTIKGSLDVHNSVDIAGNLQVDGSLTVDGVVTFKAGTSGTVALGDDSADNIDFNADVISNIIPATNNTFNLGTATQQWKDLHVDGVGNIDDLQADTATLGSVKVSDLTNNRVVIAGTAGELEDDANFTYNGTTFNLNGNVDVGNGLDVTGSIAVSGTVDGRDIATDGTLLDTHDAELGTITAAAMGTTASTVSGAILELETEIDTLNTRIEPTRAFGSTFTATTIMSGLNELKTQVDLLDSGSSDQLAQIGDLAALDTTAKNTLVAAINELDDRIDTDADFRNKVSATDAGGDGSFAYTQGTGVFTYTGPSASETRAHFSGGTEIGITSGTINHSNVSRTNTTSTGSVGYGGTFTAIDSISSNARGHVTAANVKTVTIPAAYSHPTHPGDDMSIDTGALTGATVISDLDLNVTTDTLGHVTDANATVATRTLTLANLGYTGATNANNYSHPNHSGDVTSTGDGATTIGDSKVTTAKINALAVTGAKIAADAIDGSKIADAAINSEHYVDGSIDRVHLAADIIDGTKIADDVINSEHYAAGSIDAEHLASNSVTQAKLADDAVGSAELASVVTLIIYNSAGTAIKTLYGAGS